MTAFSIWAVVVVIAASDFFENARSLRIMSPGLEALAGRPMAAALAAVRVVAYRR